MKQKINLIIISLLGAFVFLRGFIVMSDKMAMIFTMAIGILISVLASIEIFKKSKNETSVK